MDLLAPRHWRREVLDVALTIQDAASDDTVRVRTGVAAAVVAATRRGAPLAWLLSDSSPPLGARIGLCPRSSDHVFRLWWNRGDEILAAPAEVRTGATHICFFADAVDGLYSSGLDVVVLPYAFAAPVEPGDDHGSDRRITYTGEVDISDSCFASLPSARAAEASDETWDLAGEVVAGRVTLREADRHLDADRADHPAKLWALRNRVRYLLVDAVSKEFAGRLHLRGDDWAKLGFAADPTTHRRGSRFANYRRYRVSLDLGSKSTHSMLYPRTAEVLACAGGLVQFDTGAPADGEPQELEARRAGSAADLIGVVAALLDDPTERVLAENLALQRWYRELRMATGVRFLEMIRLARSAGDPSGGTT